MLFAGFDISSVAIGWSLIDRHGKVVACGTFKPKGIDVWARLAEFAPWLDAFLREHTPRAVAIEEPLRSDASRTETTEGTDAKGRAFKRQRSVPLTPMATARALYAFAGVARMLFSLHGVQCREVNQRAWRPILIGVAQAPKEVAGKKLTYADRKKWLKQTAVARATRLGAQPDTPDAAEAVGVGLWLYCEISRLAQQQRARIAAEKTFGRAA